MRRTLILALVLSFASPAAARTTADYVYTYDQLWRAAVRLIAVDFRYSITERDPEIGYVLFEYREGSRTCPGSVEIVRTGEDGVRVVVSIEAMPSYVERFVLDRLGRKLSDEYGAPPRRPRAPAQPPPQPPAADDDDEDDEGDDAPRDDAPSRSAGDSPSR
jgi:hypothetical protein